MTMIMKNLHWIMKTLWITLVLANHFCNACTFYSTTKDYPSSDTESGKFIRIKEDHAIGDEIIMFDVYPRKSIELRAIDRSSDDKYFRIREINSSTIAIHLERSLDELVDNDTPQNILKFKIQCNSMISNSNSKNHDISYLMMTVYVEDINDNKPVFLNTPYSISIDETIPFGSVVFQGIQAIDRDKPNTPNSDIQYFIGQQTVDSQGAFFMLDSPHRPHVILKRSLDFDNGIRQFDLNIIARDRGVPPQQTNTTMTVFVDDIDDLPPMFTQDVYFTKIKEFFTITGKGIHKALKIEPPIEAYDQDSINSTLVYSILSGNDKNTFWIHPTTGTLFLKKEIDLESENLAENTYNIQIDVRQKNDPMKRAMARIEIEIVDINDNLPEFEVDLYNISIVENLPNGFSVLQVNALDRDQGENSMFFYKVFQEEPQGAFSVDPVTGWMTVKNQSLLDREERASVRLLIQAVEKMKPYNKRDPTEDATVAVEITLLDANDNTPVFDMGNLYEFKVDMNASIGHQVGLIHADDPDDGKNGEIMYDMKNRKETTVPFNLNSKTGILTVTGKMLAGRIALFVEACDQPINPSEQRCSLAVLTLDIVNMSDDTEIKFMGAPYEFWISSSAPIGSSVGQVRTVYRDDIIYDLLHSYSEGVPFAIEEQSGIITVIRPINSFNRNLYSFEAVATYAHLPVEVQIQAVYMFIANVTVNIVNPSSKNTVFVKGPKNQLIEFHVQENQADAVIAKNRVSRAATPKNLSFFIVNDYDLKDKIYVSNDGKLMTLNGLDREEKDFYKLSVIAEYSNGLIESAGIYQINVIVDDENDNPPKFQHSSYIGIISENCQLGTEVMLNNIMFVSDPDVGKNSEFQLSIMGDGNRLFTIEKSLERRKQESIGPSILDRERKNFYKLRLLAKDSGGLTSEAQLMIFVTDVNDNAPVFEKISVFKQTGIEILQYTDKMEMLFIDAIESNTVAEKIVQTTPKIIRNLSAKYPLFSIEESLTPGVTILQLTATDDDYGPNSRITYEISNEIVETMSSFKGNLSQYSHTTVPFFSIDRMSGELKINRQLLPNVEIQVNITAKDAAGLVDTVTIGIRISDVNNHPPQFLRPFYSFDIEEGFHISKILGTVQALDDDFEDNANITYTVDNADNGKFPFSVTAKTGILKVSGMLDRELKSLYEFRIMAKDNSRKYNQLNATVAIEINIIDQNDNSPQFIGYDDLMIHEIPSQGRKMNSDVHKHDDDLLHQNKTPVYKASLDRHSSGRRLIKQIHAIDIDYALNGMVFYGFLHNNISHLFEIDAREGVVTTTPDEEQLKLLHKYDLINLTIVASDLGNPVRSSRALLLINLEGEKIVHPPKSEAIRITSSTSTFTSTTTTTTKAPEHKVLFVNQYYELEVVENNPIPMKLIQFNTTNNIDTYKWSMVFENHNGSTLDVTEYFNVADGVLWLMKSLDREELDFYQLRIKAEVQRTKRRGKSLQMMYPVTDDRINNLANNEVRVMVKVLDQNDHSPLFRENGPIIAVIPDTVTYGYNVLRVEAEDDDTGLNAEIRYSIFNDVTNFFGIDALTGQIRTLGPLWRSNQKVYGFDVKATDRQGDEKGNSNIVNVLVYVLDENKHVKFVMSGNTMEIEKEAETIARSLSDASGLIVKIRMLEPHEINMEFMTNVYIYAIDPKTNTVVEMEELQGIMEQLNMHEIQPSLPIIELIKYGVPAHLSPKVHQGTGKLASIVLSITILVGGLATACCIICVRYKR
ncbi:unnamed protein product [Diamesa serratosioi]